MVRLEPVVSSSSQGDDFIVSDDYSTLAALEIGQPDFAPCWVLGNMSSGKANQFRVRYHWMGSSVCWELSELNERLILSKSSLIKTLQNRLIDSRWRAEVARSLPIRCLHTAETELPGSHATPLVTSEGPIQTGLARHERGPSWDAQRRGPVSTDWARERYDVRSIRARRRTFSRQPCRGAYLIAPCQLRSVLVGFRTLWPAETVEVFD